MKRIILFILFFHVFVQASNADIFADIDQFMVRYVRAGRVDYAALSDNKQELEKLVSQMGSIQIDNVPSDQERVAFWINAYNILVINRIIEHYPVKSVEDIGGFFDLKKNFVSGQKLTLDGIEHNKLRAHYRDARIHFALVCGAIGCPVIIAEAYKPGSLEDQLDERATVTINDGRFVKVDQDQKTVSLSEIFRWYEKDFLKEERRIIDYLNRYHKELIPVHYKVTYFPYDWSLNELMSDKADSAAAQLSVQSFTPSTLLASGQVEIKFFNNLYTQTDYFDDDRTRIEGMSRSTYNTVIVSTLYGLNRRLNIGLDLYLKSVKNDEKSSSPFSVFSFSSNENSHSAATYIGPAVKISPLKSLGSLALKSTFLFSITEDPEGKENDRPFLDYEDHQFWIQLFYDRTFGNDWLMYFEVDCFVRLDQDETGLTTPVKGILNYYPSSRWTVYLPLEYGPSWSDGSISSFFSQAGLGAKYQLVPGLELELLYTVFPFGQDSGAGETYNLGIRFIR